MSRRLLRHAASVALVGAPHVGAILVAPTLVAPTSGRFLMTTQSHSVLDSPRGKRVLAVLCAVAFLDFVDASITNVALPHIRTALGFSLQTLQWVPSAYLLSYGGLMLLGGRLADLFGRRRILLVGTALLAVGSLVGGLAGSSGVFVGARLGDGLGGAAVVSRS